MSKEPRFLQPYSEERCSKNKRLKMFNGILGKLQSNTGIIRRGYSEKDERACLHLLVGVLWFVDGRQNVINACAAKRPKVQPIADM